MQHLKLIECPRDAMQGIEEFIPTQVKINYINQLLKVGFDTIDFGSFVSPKAIPQLRDTAQVLNQLELTSSRSKLLAIVANERGAEDAVNFSEIDYLGYPFSISETFQKRNTNATIEQSLSRVEVIQKKCLQHDKKLVTYLSMGFGNPYGDDFHEDLVAHWIEKLVDLDIGIFALSDTIGVATPVIIEKLFSTLIPEFSQVEIGAHLHTNPNSWKEKVEAAYKNGCRRFDGAILGYGGCPMAADELAGNMAMENLVQFFSSETPDYFDNKEFKKSLSMAAKVFPL